MENLPDRNGIARFVSGAYLSRLPQFKERALIDYGERLLKRGFYRAAGDCFSRALDLNPRSIECHCNLAAAEFCSGNPAAAVEHYIESAVHAPLDCETAANLGKAYLQLGEIDKAIGSLEQALELDPQSADAQFGMAVVRLQQGEFDVAMGHFKQALELAPQSAEAHLGVAAILLSKGEFAEGWQHYEWRLRLKNWPQRHFGAPRWAGQAVPGDRVLIHAEQGLGDTLQFLRYIPLVAARGSTVVLQVQKELVSILGDVRGASEICGPKELFGPVSWHCPLLSMPLTFGTQPGTIPPVLSYLSRSETVLRRWKDETKQFSGLRVGLCWAGDPKHRLDRFRSVSPQTLLLPLSQVEGVSLFSLQKGVRGEAPAKLHNPGWSENLTDTIAAIESLDLVITVDTMIAHLAGTMGKPVWILLSFVPDFRWMLDRETSPWYPTARLFRQPKPGDWTSVAANVADALRAMTRPF
jgi:Tfp pilus assembly protein PilF